MIYFVQPVGGGPVKIGYTSGPVFVRLKEMQTGSPVPLTVLGVVDGDVRAERRLHARFATSRLHGEWFAVSDDLLAVIRDDARPPPVCTAPERRRIAKTATMVTDVDAALKGVGGSRRRLVRFTGAWRVSPQELAMWASCSESTVSLILSGERLPSLKTAVAIERATGGKIRAAGWLS